MDAYGNLTSISEFTDGRAFRLMSYLDGDVAIGAVRAEEDDTFRIYNCSVHRMSAGNNVPVTFQFRNVKVVSSYVFFYISLVADPDYWMSYGDGGFYSGKTLGLRLAKGNAQFLWAPALLTVTFVQDCWFTLQTDSVVLAVDCSESQTNEGNPILWFEPNGGQNQIWRAATK